MRSPATAGRLCLVEQAPASNRRDKAGILPCVSQRRVARRAPGLHVHQPCPDCKENSWRRLRLPSRTGSVRSGRGTGLAICRSRNSTPAAGVEAAPHLASELGRDAGDRTSRNAVDTSAGLSYNARNCLTVCCSHQRSRSGSTCMIHAQHRIRFTAAPSIRSAACTLFLQRPQLLTRV